MRRPSIRMLSESELQRIYSEHAQSLFAFVLQLTRNEQDTRDVLQEVFVKISARPKILSGIMDERAFLIRLANNAAVDLMRRRRARDDYHERFGEASSTLFEASDTADEQAFRAALSTALEKLPPEQRAVVHLKLWEDLTFEQIATLLKIPPNTAASRYRYGIDKLRAELRPIYDEIQ